MKSRLNFITVLLIAFVDHIGLGLVYPVFAALLFDPNYPLTPEYASSAYRGALLGILISLTPLTQFFSSPILGMLSDYFGRRRTLLYGTAIGCLGYCLAAMGVWMHSLPLLLLYRICVGVSEGTVGVAQAMLADISTEENKGRRFAQFSASAGIGFMIGPFLGGKLADPSVASWCGYATPFILANAMCLVNWLLILCCFTETRQRCDTKVFKLMRGLDNLRKVFLWPKLHWLFLGSFAFFFGWSFFNEFIPVFLRERFAFTPSDVGNYYAYGGACYAVSAGAGLNPLLKIFSSEKIVTNASLGCAVSMLIFLVIQDAQWIWWIMPPFMYLLALTFPTTAALVSSHASSDNQGEVLGVYQSIIGAAMGLSPLLLGSAVGAYPSLIIWGGAVAMSAASLAFWMICRPVQAELAMGE